MLPLRPLFVLGLTLISCKSTQSETYAGKAEITETEDNTSAREFRDIFQSFAQGRYKDEEVRKLLLLPPSSLTKSPEVAKADELIPRLDAAAKGLSPSDLYQLGVKTPFEAQGDVRKELASKGPVTFIVIPGLVTEVAGSYTFHEIVTRKDSHLAKAFAKRLKEETNAEYKEDFSFDFESFREKMIPLDQLVQAGSYDDESGKPLLNVVFLKSPRLSGESFGETEENAKVYLRRITKYYRLMKKPDEAIYIVGQSRGAAIGLDLLRQAHVSSYQESWKEQLKGFISLVGILYGTPVSDAVYDAKEPIHGIFKALADLAASLEADDGTMNTVEKAAAIVRNNAKWVAFAPKALKATLALPRYPGLTMEGIQSAVPSLDPNLQLLKEIAFDKFQIADPDIDNHFRKVKKFKWMISRGKAGVDGLRTATRLKWWQTHTIPTHIPYYAIGAVLPDLSSKEAGVSPLTGNKLAFDTNALDYRILRATAYQSVAYTSNRLADGLAITNRSWFWPKAKLNPQQKPYRAYNLGVAQIDHFGIGFPEAVVTSGGHKSPFPRDLMALSLALFVTRHP